MKTVEAKSGVKKEWSKIFIEAIAQTIGTPILCWLIMQFL